MASWVGPWLHIWTGVTDMRKVEKCPQAKSWGDKISTTGVTDMTKVEKCLQAKSWGDKISTKQCEFRGYLNLEQE